MDIKPGTRVAIEIAATPRSEAAEKTLWRVCRKDAKVARDQRWLGRHRPSWTLSRRGGRMWHHQMKSTSGVTLTPGSRYVVRATLDVLRDLQSVKRWIKVSPA